MSWKQNEWLEMIFSMTNEIVQFFSRFFTSSMMFWFHSRQFRAATRSSTPTHWISSQTQIHSRSDRTAFAVFTNESFSIRRNLCSPLMAITLSSSQSKRASRFVISFETFFFSAESSNSSLMTVIICLRK